MRDQHSHHEGKVWYSVLVTIFSKSTPALPTHRLHCVALSLSLSLPLHTSKWVSVSLWGIETVNAWSFDVPLLREPGQSSICACLPSLHHLLILCGGGIERERERERLRNSLSLLFHTYPSPSFPVQNFCQMPSEGSFSHCLPSALSSHYLVASAAVHGTPLKQSPSSLKAWVAETISKVNLSNRWSRYAARQQCQTAEHDQHKEKAIAAVTPLVRYVTAFSAIHVCVYSTVHTLFLSPWEWEKCISAPCL